jgi:hypothetical protein
VLLPRDNPVKDFLLSADAKFAAFKAQHLTFTSALVIVWDDFIQEPRTCTLSTANAERRATD